MTNSNRIEKATRDFVGAILSGQEIAHLVKKMFPDWNGGIYPSDCAYLKNATGYVPRGKSAYGDGVLEYIGSDQFKVLPDDVIVRKPSTGRGRGTSVPRTDDEIAASLAAKMAKLQEAKQPSGAVVQEAAKGHGARKQNGESAH